MTLTREITPSDQVWIGTPTVDNGAPGWRSVAWVAPQADGAWTLALEVHAWEDGCVERVIDVPADVAWVTR